MPDFFLVLVRCGMDDLPIMAFADRDAAVKSASEMTPDSSEIEDASEILGVNVSIFCGVSVIRFSGGVPVEGVDHINWN